MKDFLENNQSDKYAYLGYDFVSSFPDYSELRCKMEALNSIKRITSDTVFVKDLYSDRFIHLDEQLLAYAGYDLEQELLDNDKLFELVFDAESRSYIQCFEKALVDFIHDLHVDRRAHVVGTANYSIIHKKGHRIPLTVQLTPFLSDNSKKIWALLGCISYSVKSFANFSHLNLLDTGEMLSFCHKTFTYKCSEKLSLTSTEKQVLSFCIRGFKETDIATEMDLAHNTVKSHKQNILRKLEVHNMQEAFFKAQCHKII